MIAFLDPALSGDNSEAISRKVPSGRGGVVDCQSPSSTTTGGQAAHTINWDVTLRTRLQLTNDYGVRTAMTRGDDSSLGPCVDQRAAMSNSLSPNASITVNTYRTPSPETSGFFVNYANPPGLPETATLSKALASEIRDHLSAAGFHPSSEFGGEGVLGGNNHAQLNLARFPSVAVHLGNTANPEDSKQLETAESRQAYAEALVRGIVAFLETQPSR